MASETVNLEATVRESFCAGFVAEVVIGTRRVLGRDFIIAPVQAAAESAAVLVLQAMASPSLEGIDVELMAMRRDLTRGLAAKLGASVAAAFWSAVWAQIGRAHALLAGAGAEMGSEGTKGRRDEGTKGRGDGGTKGRGDGGTRA